MACYVLVRGSATQAGERRQGGTFLPGSLAGGLGIKPCGDRGDQHREPAEHDGRRPAGKSPLAGPADPGGVPYTRR
jgi:hypothetical protein